MVSLKEKKALESKYMACFTICDNYSHLKTFFLKKKQKKNTCRGVVFLVKLQVLHKIPPEVFFCVAK